MRKVQLERFVAQTGVASVAIDFNARLTVVAGIGDERARFVDELLASLTSSRPGIHLEFVDDDQRRLAVFRPRSGGHRVVDVESAEDVSAEFARKGGGVDLLAGTGVEPSALKAAMRLGAADLEPADDADRLRALAAVDLGRLWEAASRLSDTEAALPTDTQDAGGSPGESVVELIEQRHAEFEQAQKRLGRRTRRIAVSAIVASVAALGLAVIDARLALAPLVGAVVTALGAAGCRRRLRRAEAAEREALAQVGAQSYLGFHLQRVEGMLGTAAARTRVNRAASFHREALAEWQAVAGDIPVGWALAHREEVEAVARVRSNLHAIAAAAGEVSSVDDESAAPLARALVTRLAQLRAFGEHGESFPLILDEPFVDVAASVKPALLELVAHHAGSPQVILVTNDEAIISWARLEALTGALSLLEPASALG